VQLNDNSVLQCESFGLDCSCYEPFGGGAAAETAACELADRTHALDAECCEGAGQDCSGGTPSSCNQGCAAVVLPFWADCQEALGPQSYLVAGLVDTCRATLAQPPAGNGVSCGAGTQLNAQGTQCIGLVTCGAGTVLSGTECVVAGGAVAAPACASTPCQNGGQCTDSTTEASLEAGTYVCQCGFHWYGVNCETSEDDCTL